MTPLRVEPLQISWDVVEATVACNLEFEHGVLRVEEGLRTVLLGDTHAGTTQTQGVSPPRSRPGLAQAHCFPAGAPTSALLSAAPGPPVCDVGERNSRDVCPRASDAVGFANFTALIGATATCPDQASLAGEGGSSQGRVSYACISEGSELARSPWKIPTGGPE